MSSAYVIAVMVYVIDMSLPYVDMSLLYVDMSLPFVIVICHRDTRLECVRNLTLDPFVLDVAPKNESLSAPEVVAECHNHLVEFFLAFAAGQVNEGETNPRTGEPLL